MWRDNEVKALGLWFSTIKGESQKWKRIVG